MTDEPDDLLEYEFYQSVRRRMIVYADKGLTPPSLAAVLSFACIHMIARTYQGDGMTWEEASLRGMEQTIRHVKLLTKVEDGGLHSHEHVKEEE